MVPSQSWQQALLTEGLLVLGAAARYAVAWFAARTRELNSAPDEDVEG